MIDQDQPFPEHGPLPDQCVFCGAAIVTMKDGRPCRAEDDSWVAYTCLSSVHRSRPPRKHQSTVCHALEFARLRSRITVLENEKRGLLERNGRLREIGRELVSCVEKLGTYDHDSREVLEAKEAAISRWNEEDKP